MNTYRFVTEVTFDRVYIVNGEDISDAVRQYELGNKSIQNEDHIPVETFNEGPVFEITLEVK